MLRDQLILDKNYSCLKLKCNSCGEIGHIITTCPLLHYYPDTYRLLKKFNHDNGQLKRECVVRNSCKKNSMLLFQELNKSAADLKHLYSRLTLEESADSLESIESGSLSDEEENNRKNNLEEIIYNEAKNQTESPEIMMNVKKKKIIYFFKENSC